MMTPFCTHGIQNRSKCKDTDKENGNRKTDLIIRYICFQNFLFSPTEMQTGFQIVSYLLGKCLSCTSEVRDQSRIPNTEGDEQ